MPYFYFSLFFDGKFKFDSRKVVIAQHSPEILNLIPSGVLENQDTLGGGVKLTLPL